MTGIRISIVANETIMNEEYTAKTEDDLLTLYFSDIETTKPSNI